MAVTLLFNPVSEIIHRIGIINRDPQLSAESLTVLVERWRLARYLRALSMWGVRWYRQVGQPQSIVTGLKGRRSCQLRIYDMLVS